MRLLLTAFEPFGGLNTNVSLEVLNRIQGNDIFKAVLPVSYKRCPAVLEEAIISYQPDIVLSLGQAGGSQGLRLEKLGINYTRGAIADNDSDNRTQGYIETDGPDAIFSKLPVEKLAEILKTVMPADISLSAGGYVCNTCYYSALRSMKGRALFLHLPYYQGQGNEFQPAFPLDMMIETVDMLIMNLMHQD